MKQACPGCRDLTRDVRCEGGKPIYCTQCGRGYRFIYGFYHRYLYFVFNHPVFTYAALMALAIAHSQSFPRRIQLPYLVFFSIVYWGGLKWVRGSQKYLEPLPTGPNAAAMPPRPAPAAAAVGAAGKPKRPSNRPSIFAIGVFALNLLVFPVALFAGLLSLPTTTGWLLDGIYFCDGGRDLTAALASWDLDEFRGGLTIYAIVAVLASIALLAFNIIAMSFVKARKGRGKELVIWAFVFWLISSLLFAAQIVSSAQVLTDWRDQQVAVQEKRPEAMVLADDPLFHWTQLQAWRNKGEADDALLFFRGVLDGTVRVDDRHAWVSQCIAIRLAADVIHEVDEHWSFTSNEDKADLVEKMDECCLVMARKTVDSDPTVQRTAIRSMRRLTGLDFTLPRSETFIVDRTFEGSAGRTLPPAFGSGAILWERIRTRLTSEDELEESDCEKLAKALTSLGNQKRVSRGLLKLYRATGSDVLRRRVLGIATSLKTNAVAPLLREGYETIGDRDLRERILERSLGLRTVDATPLLLQALDDDTRRYRALRALYSIYGRKNLTSELRRHRRYYSTRSNYRSKMYQRQKYERTHRNTAELWRRAIERDPARYGVGR